MATVTFTNNRLLSTHIILIAYTRVMAYGGGERCAQGVGGEARGKEAIGETQT
jgi:hypothetical protein